MKLKYSKHDNNGELCEFLLKFIMYQLFIAVNFLHVNKIVHGDIKRENLTFLKVKSTEPSDSEEKDIFELFAQQKKLTDELDKAKSIDQLSGKYLNKMEK